MHTCRKAWLVCRRSDPGCRGAAFKSSARASRAAKQRIAQARSVGDSSVRHHRRADLNAILPRRQRMQLHVSPVSSGPFTTCCGGLNDALRVCKQEIGLGAFCGADRAREHPWNTMCELRCGHLSRLSRVQAGCGLHIYRAGSTQFCANGSCSSASNDALPRIKYFNTDHVEKAKKAHSNMKCTTTTGVRYSFNPQTRPHVRRIICSKSRTDPAVTPALWHDSRPSPTAPAAQTPPWKVAGGHHVTKLSQEVQHVRTDANARLHRDHK